ncbi:MAG: glycerol-3-phosphate dehydrogenase [Epulopiscium sp.]|jgi:glycerol-3-phosphate dehydrogenase|uniref:FAD-dependent oxidoreductase n=1 Tax=Defluviitalea raffinosedens TaxID=1450156 RepID=A0A7C8HDD6_9FIRM|nr:NAD(P)/FAD-dependent oxidoreductase [Defluviitalea raffinosedens]MBZ4669071.1 dependent oxidoreductase [Defluviitaleaceae bacterium]MDK2787001.1 glycerol-3-phosphate dehydrogenase [Candidatus Epulonipiscium sp.]KAE9630225.1 FAD-dependent oxidoreductase [Defluviitalea raffinosedens]MBM7686028.1 glycerol-3-phosphate dehydrogenase [Defluviitalea raffinosedens]HHW67725.1 NAD(P)/FAD-dependent oxidoreductase [Candidatus Epulonipiscium sp.]
MYDVVIVGAGVVGCAIARAISKYQLKSLVLEKENDVCCGTSKANSAIVHAGYDALPETLKGKLNAKANLMFDQLAEELDFPFRRNGSLVLCFDENDKDRLYALKERGEKNGVPDLQIISGDEVRRMEPNVSDKVVAALYAPTGGIVCPFNLTIALAENAKENGVEFNFNSEVTDIHKLDDGFEVKTKDKTIRTKILINAAGVYADQINNKVSAHKFTIIPRKGEYNLFDKYVGNLTDKTLFQLPTKFGKGVLVTPTVDGNLLVGPNAVDIEDKEDVSTTREGLDDIMERASLSIKSLPKGNIITSFSGLRARSEKDDFIIGEVPDVPGFINAAGIESPGLTCAPLIGIMVSDIIRDQLNPKPNENFNPKRKGIVRFNELSLEEKRKMIKERPEYGRIVCRCESVTEGEILDAINRPLGAKDLDGIKRRTRAGAGRCQAGFCISRTMELLHLQLNIPPTEITKFGKASKILVGTNKEFI